MIEIEALGWVVSIDPTAVLAPGMFLALVAALLSGFPVAFCLGGIGVIFALLGMLSGEIEPQFVTALPQRILGIMANFTLLAIPAFVFMGAMLESSGIAERLLDTMGFDQLFERRNECCNTGTGITEIPAVACEEGEVKKQVLAAHRTLMAMNDENADAFKDLVNTLERP